MRPSEDASAFPVDERESKGTRSWLSEGQKGLWWLQKTSASSSVYNIALCSRLDGRVESGLLEQALSLMVKRHPVLTGVICEENGV
ncbi:MULTISPECIES: condensation domain-containing protein, partial [unclassified Bradyrhizobium]|uniref:condensation domain-containing protein n=1 Tax=unclassified Bradyrhizobium TaxID=2631580 RepID=UPI002915CE21